MAENKKINGKSATDSGSLAQLGSLTEAFSGSDFSTISIEEFKNDPVAAKIMTILYAQSEKEKKQIEAEVSVLRAKVKYYRSIQATNIAFAIVSVLGTLIIGLGVSYNKTWLIVLGGALVVIGEILPLILNKKGDEL